ncbi:NUDIX hydrolase [Nocardiopsis sp. HUAS JQ3]|uniref:NUDIX hydrolase n=1 Tax=Nocardiopsis sp. HUAS JQ3 TaxID=3061629 RepID=UPI0023A9908C|nr:NUDIX domain-containing protein [Nocardiopsis sp. HUAS JQ3]WDZ90697.1 NUDIX domain-containing protein [Nocardiopsis sp. HUAS JQ3]
MSIPNTHIRAVLDGYLRRFPEEAESVGLLRRALDSDHELSSRKEFRIGHATAGAIVLDPRGRVLLIHHNALDTWLLPGGHLEPEDGALYEASLRELKEETGIVPERTETESVTNTLPIDLDIHQIPANPVKGEPEHWHFDFRYLHRVRESSVRLQAEEVGDHAWRPHSETGQARLAEKVTRALSG